MKNLQNFCVVPWLAGICLFVVVGYDAVTRLKTEFNIGPAGLTNEKSIGTCEACGKMTVLFGPKSWRCPSCEHIQNHD